MAPDIENAASGVFSLIGVGLRGEGQVRLVLGGTGSGQDVFEGAIGRCLRGEMKGGEEEALKWIADKIDEPGAIDFVTLQKEINSTDLDFFRRYWASQFSTLITYPKGIKKPAVTTDSGLQVESGFSKT